MREAVIPLILLSTLILTACKQVAHAPVPAPDMQHGSMEPMKTGEDMTVRDQSQGSKIAFTIEKDGKAVEKYGISHTKEMHLIIVRDDLEHFQHLHPDRDADGMWSVDYELPAPGTYWLYADFVDPKGNSHLLRFQRDVPGDVEMNGFQLHPGKTVKNADGYDMQEKTVDGYHIQMFSLTSADAVTFNYHIRDAAGHEVQTEDYLGEKGHSILLSRDGGFIHTHPSKEYVGYKDSDPPVFLVDTDALKDPLYRIFTQFKIRGEVHTVAFDWNR